MHPLALLFVKAIKLTLVSGQHYSNPPANPSSSDSHSYQPLLYRRTPVTRTLKGNEKHFEKEKAGVIGVDWKIHFAVVKIDDY